MAAEPIMIYSHKVDPQGVAAVLRSLAPDLLLKPGAGGWTQAAINRPRSSIVFNHDQDYYIGADFPRQMNGMQGYFSRFPDTPIKDRVMMLISTLQFGISLFPVPQPDLYIDSDDERLKYIFAVVKYLDGIIFVPSGLRDAAGRVIYDANGYTDPAAKFPGIYMEAPAASEMPLYMGGTQANPPGPAAERIAKRALCLAAVSYRGMLQRENDSIENLKKAHAEFIQWVNAAGIVKELEPGEKELLLTKLSSADPQKMINAEWQLEAAAVLAWAVGAFELPAYDAQVDVGALGRALGLSSADRAKQFIAGAVRRSDAEIEKASKQLLAIHWRLREFQQRPDPMGFESKSQELWFGKLPLDGIKFAGGDLAVFGNPLSAAPNDDFIQCALIVQERHKAINWLCGASEKYSETDTPT